MNREKIDHWIDTSENYKKGVALFFDKDAKRYH